jgi:LytS/YehU family sensor histidine kinase
MSNYFKIEDIVDLELFQETLDTFFDATRSIRIGLKNPEGVTLLKAYRPGPEISPVCRLIRSTPEGKQRCAISDRNGTQMSKEKGGYTVYRCHAGLTDFAIPLYYEEEFIGALMSGQIFLTPLTSEVENQILERCKGLPIDQEALRESLHQVSVIPIEDLEPILRLVDLIGQNVIERELNARRRSELYEERLRIAHEQQRAAELEANLNVARFETLQAQINPHFMFNTLNTVARLAVLEAAPKTEKMAYALSRILRYSLRKVDQPVSLVEEFQQVSTYLEIQKIRFQERLEYEIDVTPSIQRLMVPCFSIQPLVENSLIHGLEPKLNAGNIKVSAHRKQGKCIIQIEDNGVGISQEKLNQINAGKLEQHAHANGTGIGIENVKQRLELFFGEPIPFEIVSAVNVGTTIRIELPL